MNDPITNGVLTLPLESLEHEPAATRGQLAHYDTHALDPVGFESQGRFRPIKPASLRGFYPRPRSAHVKQAHLVSDIPSEAEFTMAVIAAATGAQIYRYDDALGAVDIMDVPLPGGFAARYLHPHGVNGQRIRIAIVRQGMPMVVRYVADAKKEEAPAEEHVAGL